MYSVYILLYITTDTSVKCIYSTIYYYRYKCTVYIFYYILLQIQVYSVGDAVIVSRDMAKVKELQKGHGEWTDSMSAVSFNIYLPVSRNLYLPVSLIYTYL